MKKHGINVTIGQTQESLATQTHEPSLTLSKLITEQSIHEIFQLLRGNRRKDKWSFHKSHLYLLQFISHFVQVYQQSAS